MDIRTDEFGNEYAIPTPYIFHSTYAESLHGREADIFWEGHRQGKREMLGKLIAINTIVEYIKCLTTY